MDSRAPSKLGPVFLQSTSNPNLAITALKNTFSVFSSSTKYTELEPSLSTENLCQDSVDVQRTYTVTEQSVEEAWSIRETDVSGTCLFEQLHLSLSPSSLFSLTCVPHHIQ